MLRTVKTMAQIQQENESGGPITEVRDIHRHSQRLVYVPFTRIRLNRTPLFKPYGGERFADLAENVRQNGILVPPILRPVDDPDYDYEMLAGQNRMRAGVEVGLEGTHCMVKEGLTEAEANTYVIATNIFQRSFSDMTVSEKAAVLAFCYSDMFSQGKRNDILHELEELEESEATCGNGFHKLSKSRDELGESYGLTGRAVANYIRINKLIYALKNFVDMGRINLMAGVQLSYINEEGQVAIGATLSKSGGKLERNKAQELRSMASKGQLTEEMAERLILPPRSAPAVGPVTLSKLTRNRYFGPDTPKKEVEETLDRAISFYFRVLAITDDPESLLEGQYAKDAG